MARSRIAWACLLLAAACVAGRKADEAFTSQLLEALGGSYDNLAQSRASPDHAPVHLVIAPVPAPLVGDHVFYVQEMAADDPRRVMAQRLYIVDPVKGKQLAVIRQADFAEPLRWRDGQLNRDLFRSLLPQDLRPRSGCELLVRPEAQGFAGATGEGCRGSDPDTGEAQKVEQRIQFNPDGIALFEQRRDALGKLVYGGEPDPWYRFGRRADAPW